ncbi:glycosyltransferase family 2 protein [Thioalkalivibrio thiocyanodenitrificans]|uniref:glycosyltransferase family 2 protein n=1 Tax=Thioalkalivibrio thiocyanodenitrificans TaxID=243063 RepID=UPI0009FFF365|nr:glycosyltransferase family 2 protein [Thioalkalivibrio thiocyanodenitrificans]
MQVSLPARETSVASTDDARVVAVVVTHHPDPEGLRGMLRALVPQVHGTWIVDNGSGDCALESLMEEFRPEALRVHRLCENRGIAHAQNEGIRLAGGQGATHVLLMDQDSVPAPDMVQHLLQACGTLERVASVGPYYTDPRLPGHTPFLQVRGLRIRRRRCDGTGRVFEVDHVISSGCLIPLSAIKVVGDMREDLFIDAVDIEWGLRAMHHGLRNYGVCKATMHHSLGDASLKMFGRTVSRHSPVRLYYQFRNAILLCREPHVPLNWKVVYLRQMLLRYALYVWRVRPLRPHLAMIHAGVRDGIRGVTGAYRDTLRGG